MKAPQPASLGSSCLGWLAEVRLHSSSRNNDKYALAMLDNASTSSNNNTSDKSNRFSSSNHNLNTKRKKCSCPRINS